MTYPAERRPVVLVVGDIAVDILAPMGTFPQPGGDYQAPRLDLHCGGVGANAAIALARWGVTPRLVGCVGQDCFGEFATRYLASENVNVSGVQQTERASTGIFFIVVTPDGQRTFFGSRGANAELTSAAASPNNVDGAQAAYLVGYTFLSSSAAQAAEQVLDLVRGRGGLVAFDAGMSASSLIPQKILLLSRKVDILFAGLDEAAALTGQQERDEAFRALQQAGPGEVVLKLGKQGCLFSEGGALQQAPAIPVATKDSTGAGDAFDAAFLQARLRGWPRTEAALLANAAGAAVASTVGAGGNMAGADRVAELLRASRLDDRWETLRLRVLERLDQELTLKTRGKSMGGET